MPPLALFNAVLTVLLGIGAGGMLARARYFHRNSPNWLLHYTAPVMIGAIIVWILVRVDPVASYLPSVYLWLGMWSFYHANRNAAHFFDKRNRREY